MQHFRADLADRKCAVAENRSLVALERRLLLRRRATLVRTETVEANLHVALNDSHVRIWAQR